MSTTTAPDRIRQIAILISSVDGPTARQLLLHLPTETTRQVRAAASQLGTVSLEEKRRILSEFQRTARTSSTSATASTSRFAPPLQSGLEARGGLEAKSVTKAKRDKEAESDTEPARNSAHDPRPATPALHSNAHLDEQSTAWVELSTEALLQIIRSERPAVIAVVLSQLPPKRTVELLSHLPSDVAAAVLQRLSKLQDVDAEAMAAIDEHLAQRLGEYHHRRQSELENSRRIEAILDAAPAGLRSQWSLVLGDTPTSSIPRGEREPASATSHEPQESITGASQLDLVNTPEPPDDSPGEVFREETSPDIIPFPGKRADSRGSEVDSSLVRLEFEQILSLPPHALATLLSTSDSELVLLALAGATPQFMQRFSKLLAPRDAKALNFRLQRIGTLNLRDIDEAQRRIVENAAAMYGTPGQRARTAA